jgi:hypothetical protein
MKWSMRDPWSDRFAQVLEDHLLPACDETGLTVDDVISTLGEDFFTSTVWACAFEDFLTREFDDGDNVVDAYLKRRGWKESASVRNYLAALRNSKMSLYEVSDIIPGTSFRARDLVRGGEPALISEKTATRSFKPWDRIAARIFNVGPQTQISGAALPYQQQTSEALIEALRSYRRLSDQGKRELAASIWQDIDEAALAGLSPTEMLGMIGSMFTTFWLVDLIDRVDQIPAWPETEWRLS